MDSQQWQKNRGTGASKPEGQRRPAPGILKVTMSPEHQSPVKRIKKPVTLLPLLGD
jgi:hypothetical protein